MRLGRTGWSGLAVVGFGWLVLSVGGPLTDLVFAGLGRPSPAADMNFGLLAQSLMLTGFGVAILAVLQGGFGALNRFFEAVLQRSAGPRQPAASAAMPDLAAAKTVSRGRVNGRGYTLFADGSVDVETLLGNRRFSSLDEAREFIGYQ